MLGEEYFDRVIFHLKSVKKSQFKNIEEAANLIASSLVEGRVLHVFGCGHSQLLASELFYRAGGLVPINAMIENPLSPGEGVKSSWFERIPGYASIILDSYQTSPGEVIIIISTSGLNIVPVEMAIKAKEKGLKIVTLTSLRYRDVFESRHPSGKMIADLSDVVIDSDISPGDAAIEVPGYPYKMAPLSGIIGASILWALICEIVSRLSEKGIEPPIWISGNIPGGDDTNLKLLNKYRPLIKKL